MLDDAKRAQHMKTSLALLRRRAEEDEVSAPDVIGQAHDAQCHQMPARRLAPLAPR